MQADLIVCQAEHVSLFAAPYAPLILDFQAQPVQSCARASLNEAQLAYLMYTSGTSGQPNGVMMARSALAHFVQAAAQRYHITATDRVLQFAPLHFDACIEEIYLTLCSGASLVLRDEAMLASMPQFLQFVAHWQITVLDLPTAFWHELVLYLSEAGASLPHCVRLVIIGGEAASSERLQRWLASVPPQVILHNTYGPTEACVVCTTAQFSGAAQVQESVPIGKIFDGLGFAVCQIDDGEAQILPVGSSGELLLIGPNLANGYWQRPQLTQQRFIQLNCLPDAPRAYRTGDLVRLLPSGDLLYLGRLDEEIKISGQRIDLREIENAMLGFAGVVQAAVVAQVVIDSSPKQLHAFLATTWQDDSAQSAALREYLAQQLPAVAIPNSLHLLPSLPKNANGKLDRKQLLALANVGWATCPPKPQTINQPTFAATTQTPSFPHAVSGNPQQRQTAVFSTENQTIGSPTLQSVVLQTTRLALGLPQLQPDDDIFAAGARSLHAIQLANRLSLACRCEVAVSQLFRFPSVRQLVQHIQCAQQTWQTQQAALDPYAAVLPIAEGQRGTLFCLHPAEGLAWCYFGLARHLPGIRIIGLQAAGMRGAQPESIEAQVQAYATHLRQLQPHGPYALLGWSSGGGLAQALAGRLQAEGEQVDCLALMDAYPSDIWQGLPSATPRDALLALLDVVQINDSPAEDQANELSEAALWQKLLEPNSQFAGLEPSFLQHIANTALQGMHLYRQLAHPPFHGDVLFFQAQWPTNSAPDWRRWQKYCPQLTNCIPVASSHNGMAAPQPLAHIGRVLAQRFGLVEPPLHIEGVAKHIWAQNLANPRTITSRPSWERGGREGAVEHN